MSYALQVFVSSTCHELRDLRASVRAWLSNLGLKPLLSDEGGFPHIDGMPPYATCLRVLEECPLVLVVIDRRYGQGFEDWGPYTQHKGCAPTHAELRHALDLGKRVLIYIHNDTWNFYETWRKNPDAFKTAAPQGLDEGTLKMFQELKQRSPAPWIERFSDVSDVLKSLNSEFINQVYAQLQEKEKQSADSAAYLLNKILEAAPEVREKVTAGLSPDLVTDRESLQQQLSSLEAELRDTEGATQEKILNLAREKSEVQARFDAVTQQLQHTSILLTRAAMKDAPWLDFIRRTMLPKQPGRVPFHNSVEVALRGYHTAGGRQTPVLREVTWSKLPYTENGLHRGFKAGILFIGSQFTPGITFTHRRRGETGPPTGNTDYFWHLPNTFFGEYLEVSCSDDEIESPLSWRDYEFQVRNPEGQKSNWVLFTYPFDDEMLNNVRAESSHLGKKLLGEGRAPEAIEPLRKAYVFSDRMLGIQHEETLRAQLMWEEARNEAALAKLRYRVGEVVTVSSGPCAGKSGVIERLLLNHLHAYVIKPSEGELFQASDEQINPLASSEAITTY